MLTKKPNRARRFQPSVYNPFEGFFRNDFMDLWNGNTSTVPSVNIREEKNGFEVELAAPGLKKEDFNIDVEGNILTISCEKESETKEGGDSDNFSRREYNYSSFSRSLTLPDNANVEKVSAKYSEGVLHLSIPKNTDTEKQKSQKIRVE
jgi:HSP20 family protein